MYVLVEITVAASAESITLIKSYVFDDTWGVGYFFCMMDELPF